MGPNPRTTKSKTLGVKEAKQSVLFLTIPLGDSDAGPKLRTTDPLLISATVILCSGLPISTELKHFQT